MVATFEELRQKPDPLSFETMRGERDKMDVFGFEQKSAQPMAEYLRPVLQGTERLEDFTGNEQLKQTLATMEPKAAYEFRQRMIATMLLGDAMETPRDKWPVLSRNLGTATKPVYGRELQPDEIINALSPYRSFPRMESAPEQGFFHKAFEAVKDKFYGPVQRYYYDGQEIRTQRNRGPIGRAVWGKESIRSKSTFERKGLKESVMHGLGQAGVRMTKSLGGTMQAVGDIDQAYTDKLDLVGVDSAAMADYGKLLAESADLYYRENPREAMQLQPGTGILGTTVQLVTRPEMIVQGAVETVPMLLEAYLGHITGTKAAKSLGKGAQLLPWAGRVTGMGSEIFGTTYSDARAEGKDVGPALAQATLTAAIEGTIEEAVLSEKVKIFETAKGAAARHGLAKLSADVVLGSKKLLAGAKNAYIRGAGEEGLQTINANFWSLFFADNPNWSSLQDGLGESMATGGLLEMTMTGGFSAVGKAVGFLTDTEKLQRVKGFADWAKENTRLSKEHKQEIAQTLEQVQTDILAGRYKRGQAAQRFQEHVKRSFNIDDNQARAAMALVEARAAAKGQNTEDFIMENFAGISESEIDEQGNIKQDILFQDDEHSDTYQRRLLRDIREQIKKQPVYQAAYEAVADRMRQIETYLGTGRFYFGEHTTEALEYAEGKPGLRQYIATEPGTGRAFDDAWDEYYGATVGMNPDDPRYTETAPSVQASEFLDMLAWYQNAKQNRAGINSDALEAAKGSNDPAFVLLAEKYSLIESGEPVETVNQRIRQLAENIGLNPDEAQAEMMLTELEHGKEQRAKSRKAATEFLEDGRAVLHAFEKADLSSVVHELAHVFRRTLPDTQLVEVEKWAGVKDGQWTVSAEEKFARGFERYLYEGQTSNQALRAVFAKLRAWLREIYERFRGSAIDVKITPEVRKVFETMLTSQEIHPGEMTFDDFFEKLGQELMNPVSDWVRQYTLGAQETPTQMHRRLKREWQAQRDLEALAGSIDVSELTPEQLKQISDLEKAAKQKEGEVYASEKSLTIAELLDRNASDIHLVRLVKEQLKEAYQKGRAAGIEKAKKHYLDVLTKARARRELREYIKKLARQISRPAPATVDLFYREAIALLQAGIDPSFRQRKTLGQREATRKFLEQYPDKDLPVKLMQVLNKKALNEYTIAELEDLSKEVARLTKQGKLKRQLRIEQHQRHLDDIVSQIVENITGKKPVTLDNKPVAASTKKKPPVRTFLKAARASTLRPSRIFDMFDGGKGTFSGIMHKTFYDAVNRAYDAKLRKVDERIAAGNQKLAELGLTLKELAEKRVISGVEFSVQEMLGIYGYSLNDKSRLAVVFGNRISNRMIENIRHHVENEDPRLAEFVRWMIGEYDQHFDRLENAFIEVEEKRLMKEENYLPMRRQELDYTPDNRQILNEMLERQHFKRAYAEKGFTIQRADIPDEFQKPIRLDLFSMWMEQVDKQEHFIHLGALTRDLHRIERNERFVDAVQNTFGDEFLKETKDYVSRVANPHIYKGYGYFERVSRTLRKNAAISYLAYNLVTMAKQLPSLLFYLPDAGAGHLLASVAEFVRNPKKMIDFVRALDPQVCAPGT